MSRDIVLINLLINKDFLRFLALLMPPGRGLAECGEWSGEMGWGKQLPQHAGVTATKA